MVQAVKNLLLMQETWLWSLGQEDHLEKEIVTHSSILAWEIPWTEGFGGLPSMGLQRVGHDWATNPFTCFHTSLHLCPFFLGLIYSLGLLEVLSTNISTISIYFSCLCVKHVCVYMCKCVYYMSIVLGHLLIFRQLNKMIMKNDLHCNHSGFQDIKIFTFRILAEDSQHTLNFSLMKV